MIISDLCRNPLQELCRKRPLEVLPACWGLLFNKSCPWPRWDAKLCEPGANPGPATRRLDDVVNCLWWNGGREGQRRVLLQARQCKAGLMACCCAELLLEGPCEAARGVVCRCNLVSQPNPSCARNFPARQVPQRRCITFDMQTGTSVAGPPRGVASKDFLAHRPCKVRRRTAFSLCHSSIRTLA